MHRLTAPPECATSSTMLAPYCSSISTPGWTFAGSCPAASNSRLVDKQLVGADPGGLGWRRRRGQAVQVTFQAGAMVDGQDQQHPVLRRAAVRGGGRGLRPEPLIASPTDINIRPLRHPLT